MSLQRAKTTTAAAGAAAAAAVDGAKPKHAAKSHKGAANQLTQWTRQQLQPVLSSEQLRWRDKLAAFLCRPVDVPLLAPTAPVLDLQELLSKVCWARLCLLCGVCDLCCGLGLVLGPPPCPSLASGRRLALATHACADVLLHCSCAAHMR